MFSVNWDVVYLKGVGFQKSGYGYDLAPASYLLKLPPQGLARWHPCGVSAGPRYDCALGWSATTHVSGCLGAAANGASPGNKREKT